MPQDSSCTACQLHKTTTNVCVWGWGNQNADIMLVGEAPGAEEEKNGKPFVGKSGDVLDEALSKAGLSRDDIYIANTVKCRPPQNRDPKPDEMAACSTYLLEEIEAVQPKVIVALGNFALQALTGSTGITKKRGQQLQPKINTSAIVTATLHPASTLYADGARGRAFIADDLRNAKTMTGDADDHSLHIVLPEELEPNVSADTAAAFKRLARAPEIFVDLEWSAGKEGMVWPWAHRGEVYSVAMTGFVDGRYQTVSIGLPAPATVFKAIHLLLQTRPSIFHNGSADMYWIAALGVRGVRYRGDTMIRAHLLDETQDLSLEAVSGRYGSVPPGWKGVLYQARPAGQMAWTRLLEYNGHDTYATARAWYGQERVLDDLPADRAEAIRRLHDSLVIPGTRVLIKSAYVGVPINNDSLLRNKRKVEVRLAETAERLAELVGTTPKGAAQLANSPQQTTAYIKRSLGVDIETSRQDDLKELIDYPAVEAILDYRRDAKLLSAYFAPWARLLHRQGDGRLHTMYRPTGTRTGRMSTEGEGGGTLHTAPRAASEDENWIREIVEAPFGKKIVAADFSQIELRVIAWVANEPVMLELYRNGEDLHYATAAFIKAAGESGGGLSIQDFWADRERWIAQVTKAERQSGKGANFGLAYGMMPAKLRTYTKSKFGVSLTMDQAHFIRQSYFNLYAGLLPWHEQIMSFAREHGFVTTVFGRQLSIDPRDAHVAINTPIQSIASDMTLLAISVVDAKIRALGLNAIVIGFVHDSIILEVADADVEVTKRLLKDTMENLNTAPFGFRIPIPIVADVKAGQTWAD